MAFVLNRNYIYFKFIISKKFKSFLNDFNNRK